MSKRNLLLCFDAFDTLFTPKRSIAQQYGEVARSLGLGGFSDEQLQASFKNGKIHRTYFYRAMLANGGTQHSKAN